MTNGTTRRGFIGAIGTATAASMLPTIAVGRGLGSAAGPAPRTWAGAVMAWPEAVAAVEAYEDGIVARFRPVYIAEVRRLAEKLAPRFASGELRGLRNIDEERPWNSRSPLDTLEAICARHFGIEVRQVPDDQGNRVYVGDELRANLINAVSPSAKLYDPEDDWNHPGYCAEACAAFDVLAVARVLKLYTPTDDENPGEEKTAWAREALS